MTTPTVGVIVACFERPAGVDALVAALAKQTFTDFELLAVDQVGDPRVESTVDGASFATRYLTVISQGRVPKHGRRPSNASRARNTGAVATDAVILVFTDDDCVPEPDWLEKLTAPLRGDPDVIAVTGPNRVLQGIDNEPVEERFAGRRRPHLFAGQGGSSNLAVRRHDFLAVGGFDTSIGPGTANFGAEDQHLIWRLLIRAEETGRSVACRRDAVVTDRVPGRRLAKLRQRWDYWSNYGRFLRRESSVGEAVARELFHEQSRREVPGTTRSALAGRHLFTAAEGLVSEAGLLWGWYRGPRFAPFAPEVGPDA